jgi:hypothetical protein
MATQLDTATTIVTGQVAVTSTAGVLLSATRATRTKLTISSSVPIYVADTALGAATGYAPFGTNNGGINYDMPTQDAVYAQAVGPSGTVSFMEFHS